MPRQMSLAQTVRGFVILVDLWNLTFHHWREHVSAQVRDGGFYQADLWLFFISTRVLRRKVQVGIFQTGKKIYVPLKLPKNPFEIHPPPPSQISFFTLHPSCLSENGGLFPFSLSWKKVVNYNKCKFDDDVRKHWKHWASLQSFLCYVDDNRVVMA